MRFPLRAATLSAAIALSVGAPVHAHPDPGAKKVAILIFPGVENIDYTGPYEVLADAGFEVFAVAATKEPVPTAAGDGLKLTPKYSFADAPQADLIVIPGGSSEAEASGDSPTAAWIKRESEHAQHVMAVCNGAFALANTGLLDGLRATTTAWNINRLRQNYPKIHVVTDQRVVDNGKFVTTAGLSTGIDGALHMVDVMKGGDSGKSVALAIEYDWRPGGGMVRGLMADRVLPSPWRVIGSLKSGEFVDAHMKGDTDSWETIVWFSTKLDAPDFTAKLAAAYALEYSREGGPWAPASVRTVTAGPLETNLKFEDRNGGHWTTAIKVEPEADRAHQVAIRIAVARAG